MHTTQQEADALDFMRVFNTAPEPEYLLTERYESVAEFMQEFSILYLKSTTLQNSKAGTAWLALCIEITS